MNEKQLCKYLGLAIRAGALEYGIDNIKKRKSNIYLIIYTFMASDRLKKSIINISEKNDIPAIYLEDNSIDNLLHTTNCKVIGIKNSHLAKQIICLNKGVLI